jgi:acyl-[acyl-carrier-protein] desaturase
MFDLLRELEPVVAREMNRHLSVAQEWFPHEYVPWTEGRTFDSNAPWRPEDSTVSPLVTDALLVNLLTEDNLPSYHHVNLAIFGEHGAWSDWSHRWAAEEGRHSIVIRDHLTVTRAIDPYELERARMAVTSLGYGGDHGRDPLLELTYVVFQELATRISHRNTGRASEDPSCERMLTRVALDENLHMLFFRNLLTAALELAPDETMRAITTVLTDFRMPGYGIPGFTRRSLAIALAGIYDVRIHHDEVIRPILRHWGVFELTGLDASGEQARDELAAFLAKLDRSASRFVERREARQHRLALVAG